MSKKIPKINNAFKARTHQANRTNRTKHKNTSVLEQIGFTQEEVHVYKMLLEYGESNMSQIVRKIGMHRPTAYKTIDSLIEKGLVSIVPHGKSKSYIAQSPDKIERLFRDLEDDLNIELYELSDAYNNRGKKPIVKFMEGDKAILESFEDIVHSLKKHDTYYRYSSALTLDRVKYLPKDYKYLRDKKQLDRYVISDDSARRINPIKKLGKYIKFIPKGDDLFALNVSQMIYGNKVTYIDYNSKTVIEIENEMIAEFQKRLFKLLYGKL